MGMSLQHSNCRYFPITSQNDRSLTVVIQYTQQYQVVYLDLAPLGEIYYLTLIYLLTSPIISYSS